ncbi:MAG TPA: hypothetical protein VGA66_18590 [Mycobacterium sp.]
MLEIEAIKQLKARYCRHLRTDIFNPLFSVRISDRLSRAAAKLARR